VFIYFSVIACALKASNIVCQHLKKTMICSKTSRLFARIKTLTSNLASVKNVRNIRWCCKSKSRTPRHAFDKSAFHEEYMHDKHILKLE